MYASPIVWTCQTRRRQDSVGSRHHALSYNSREGRLDLQRIMWTEEVEGGREEQQGAVWEV
eukprot:2861868-Rhodomonas_salina.1